MRIATAIRNRQSSATLITTVSHRGSGLGIPPHLLTPVGPKDVPAASGPHRSCSVAHVRRQTVGYLTPDPNPSNQTGIHHRKSAFGRFCLGILRLGELRA